ncbi:unnamed protein product [Gordionus sp. m RMFG-2023]
MSISLHLPNTTVLLLSNNRDTTSRQSASFDKSLTRTTCKPIQNYSQSLAGYSQGQSMNLPDQDDSQSLAGYSQGQSVNLPDQDSNCLRKDIYRYQHKVIYN